jgi:hypothetical protein
MGSGASSVTGAKPDLDAHTSISMMLKVIDGLSLDQSGTFYNHTGKVVPW